MIFTSLPIINLKNVYLNIFLGRTGLRYLIPTGSFVSMSIPLNTSLYFPFPTFRTIWKRSGLLNHHETHYNTTSSQWSRLRSLNNQEAFSRRHPRIHAKHSCPWFSIVENKHNEILYSTIQRLHNLTDPVHPIAETNNSLSRTPRPYESKNRFSFPPSYCLFLVVTASENRLHLFRKLFLLLIQAKRHS